MRPAETAVRQPATSDPAARPRILVADDSRVIRMAIMKILGTDFDVVQVENGAMAWEQICQDSAIQAVLTDIQMPQMDGYELICRIRAAEQPRVRELPVITITGSDDEAIREQALACGATDFIVKPLDALQLRARLQAYARYDQTTRELAEKSQTLEEQAITDPQTGLRSRRYLMQRGEQDIAFARRHAQDVCLLRVDIDGFKKIYRTHGDQVGDRLIVWVAKLLFATARTEDTVARVAGAEFAILATNTGMAEARPLCERIQVAMTGQPFSLGNVSIPVTVTIGLASLKEDQCETMESLTRLAYQRLCHASSEGGNRICTSIMDSLQVEEVMLTPVPEPAPVLPPAVIPEEPVWLPEDALSAPDTQASLAEAEITVSESGLSLEPLDLPAVEEGGIGTEPAVRPEPLPAALVSVDRALALIAQGQGRMLLPYLEQLMRDIGPLIELHERTRAAKA